MNEERRPVRGGAHLHSESLNSRSSLPKHEAPSESLDRVVTGSVAVRDLRNLPFFQVRLAAVAAIRDAAPQRARARTIGFYAICCQLANEHRHSGEQSRFLSNYDELASRARIARKTVRSMLSTLDDAGVLRVELKPDLERGAILTTLHLPIQDGPFAAITVAMANHLAAHHGHAVLKTGRGDLGAYLTRDLGVVATLLEFCVRQYGENNGASALLERAELARRAGLSIDSVDNCVKVLENLGVLSVERRRGSNGGRFRPSIYNVVEPHQVNAEDGIRNAEQENRQGGGSPSSKRRFETGKAEPGNRQGGASVVLPRSLGTDKAEHRPNQGGGSVLPGVRPQPSNASGAMAVEEEVEKAENPLTPFDGGPDWGDGNPEDGVEARLCRALVAVLSETRGPTAGRRYSAEAAAWEKAAGRLLADHPLGKLREAIAYLPCDQVVGTKVRSMPDFERHVEDLRHRAHAAKLQQATARTPGKAMVGGLAWSEAKGLLIRAIGRHGAGAKAVALAELEAVDPLLRRFAEQVGWGALCRSPFEKQDYVYRMSWDVLSRERVTEEAAA